MGEFETGALGAGLFGRNPILSLFCLNLLLRAPPVLQFSFYFYIHVNLLNQDTIPQKRCTLFSEAKLPECACCGRGVTECDRQFQFQNRAISIPEQVTERALIRIHKLGRGTGSERIGTSRTIESFLVLSVVLGLS